MSVGEFTASNIAVDQDNQELKAERKGTIDYTKLDADIKATKELAAKGNFTGALEGLLNIEKQQRLGEDITGTKKACTAVLELLLESKQWKQLNEHILLLSKRRSQLKQVVQDMVRQAMGYIDQTPDKDTRVELIKTLQVVTEGKIYVEIERARLSKRLAQIKESDGDIDAAAEILQEVAVETFGAMAKTEKIAFILEQVRLCLERKDYVRAQILSRKVSPRAFKEQPGKKGQEAGEVGIEGTTIQQPEEGTPALRELKLQYYQLQIQYFANSKSYLDICRCYRAIYEDEQIAGDKAQWEPILKKICWFVILAQTSSDQLTLLNLTAADKKLQQLPEYSDLLQLFITQEIVWWWKIEERYSSEMQSQAEVFGGEPGAKAKADLQSRVTEHNILVVSKYYAQLRVSRLATLLDLPEDKTEEALSELVVSKAVSAKIDRLSGIVRFAGPQTASSVLNTWAQSISKLLEVVERSCQQIQKESMVHRVPIGSKQQPFKSARTVGSQPCRAALVEPQPNAVSSSTSTVTVPQTDAGSLAAQRLVTPPPELYLRGRQLLGGREVEESALRQCVELHERWQRGERGPALNERWQGKAMDEAYECCARITAEYAKTFYLGTRLMTPEKARAIWAIYVWCRRTDELVDGPNASRITPAALDRWEERLENIWEGRPYDILDAALADTVQRFPVHIQPFRDMIGGMRIDLVKSRYDTFDELYEYMYRVAGTVGLASTAVMGIEPGYKGPLEPVYKAALSLGIANQLTNVLRDVGEDIEERNRIYLPLQELQRFDITEAEVSQGMFAKTTGKIEDRWQAFMTYQIHRARAYFADAEAGVDYLEKDARWPVWSALILYRGILDRIETNDYNNFTKRAYVPKWQKMLSLPAAFARSQYAPNLSRHIKEMSEENA